MALILENVGSTEILGIVKEIERTQKFGDKEGKSRAGRSLLRGNILKIYFMRHSKIYL